jgi:2-keto-3-deoxy-L-rhamnonate aldolase RhmA
MGTGNEFFGAVMGMRRDGVEKLVPVLIFSEQRYYNQTAMKMNNTKRRLQNGEVVLGCSMQQFGSAEIPRIFAAAGFDFCFIDTEHGVFDLETVRDLIRSCLDRDITPIVRVGELLYSLVARVLDAGAQGIIYPRVESRQLLEEAISWTKFPPLGIRGYGLSAPQFDYEPCSFSEAVQHSNANTMVVVQFETQTAMERREELLAVPGIDVAMIGPADLSVSLGVPGEFEHPRVIDSITAFMASCARYGVLPGIQVRTVGLGKKWIERGMRFVGCGSEHGLLLLKATETMAELSAAVKALGQERQR